MNRTNLLFDFSRTWKYLTNNLDGTDWKRNNYADVSWPSGKGLLYIENAILPAAKNTPLPPRTNDVRPVLCYYFRTTFTVTNISTVTSLLFSNLVDDGVVFYLNGAEINRIGMGSGIISNATFASREVGDATTYDVFTLAGPSLASLREGVNLLAAEVHQATTGSSDIVFGTSLSEIRRVSPPPELSTVTPEDGDLTVSPSMGLGVLLSATAETNVTVNFQVRPVAARPDFTIVILPDTQFYTSGLNDGSNSTFIAQTDWIVTNRLARNIAFVTHMGDCVYHGDHPAYEYQWLAATQALYRLEDPFSTLLDTGIPYSLAVGNHDGNVAPYGHDSLGFNRYFGVSHFAGRPYYGGHYGSQNNNHFDLFSASGMDFLLLELEFAAGTNAAVMAWANQILQTYRDRRAIVVSHSLLYHGSDSGNLPFSPEGLPIYENIKANTNIFLMLCGHDPESGRRVETFNGNRITMLLTDYENQTNGGDGWLRTLQFSPSNNLIRVQTYSPTLGLYNSKANHEFVIPYDMNGFLTLKTITNAEPGFISSGDLTSLGPTRDWQWYAQVNDGGYLVRTPISQFRFAPSQNLRAESNGRLSLVARNHEGHAFLKWDTLGGQRYRVEFSDGDASGYTGVFQEIERSENEETDANSNGLPAVGYFVDDFTKTGGPPATGARYYRIRQLP